jgi:hypothetical protein
MSSRSSCFVDTPAGVECVLNVVGYLRESLEAYV